jgi:hypothetical protein
MAPPTTAADPRLAGKKHSPSTRKLMIIKDMVEAGGVGIFTAIENT